MIIELSWPSLNKTWEYDNIEDVLTRLRSILSDENNDGERIEIRLRDRSYAENIHRNRQRCYG